MIGSKDLDIQRLIGNVKFSHEGSIMDCDSAHFDTKSNIMRAFSNVVINQGDSVFAYSDYAFYEGDKSLAKLYENVKLKTHTLSELTTDSLFFDRKKQEAFYLNGGHLKDSLNTLVSKEGYYYMERKKIAFFKDIVLKNNDGYTMYSDTVYHDIAQKNITVCGPSKIENKDGDINFIYGIYNTSENTAFFDKRPILKYDNRTLEADSLIYNRETEHSTYMGNVEIIDTINSVIINSERVDVFNKLDSCAVTINPMVTFILKEDSLFMHSDKIIVKGDSIGNKLLRAFNNVKFYKDDLQGKCDSVSFRESNRTLNMEVDPVIWADEYQLTADRISIKIDEKTDKLDSIKMLENSFIVSKQEDDRFNQIKGKNMYGSFRDNQLYKLFIDGNSQSLYYLKDEQENLLGVDKSNSVYINITFQENKLSSISYIKDVDSKVFPIDKIPINARKLRNFIWKENERPKSKVDIFKKDTLQLKNE
ncbi:organic solvent tolerance superfamily protein [Ichthyobacterium seriolicida]|uniref:Organic solvent tolerance superfamily protein n=2 Tax=Ichthyobacterium seriolicida TaxID=242600 RepID=A0A1J1DWI9_9FLAO|nr:organic solvent tolerance superfamily protein [Ichthyobacterium seriolicida]